MYYVFFMLGVVKTLLTNDKKKNLTSEWRNEAKLI